MKNIVLIGAGQLGSRHLQGIKRSLHNVAIFVFDVNIEAINLARQRYEEIEENGYDKTIEYINDFEQLPQIIDIAIISTSSKPRAEITINLVKHRYVRFIVFEKFLFPSLDEYDLVRACLDENGVDAWVNCPRRMFSCHKKIKKLLCADGPIMMSVEGGNWGLCCNSIHFVDLFSWILNETDFSYDLELEQMQQESKRKGYIEFFGKIVLKTEHGDLLQIASLSDVCSPPIIKISSQNHQIVVNESAAEMTLDGVKCSIKVPYQSELTGAIVDSILANGDSEIVKFNCSAKLHLDFLKNILLFYAGGGHNSCPIT